MSQVEKSIDVNVPLSTAYNQWTQFEEFPRFMDGVKEVRQLDDQRLHWVAEISGHEVAWDAAITEQTADRRIAWQNISGATNTGAVEFTPVDQNSTRVTLFMEYEPQGLVESAGDWLGFVSRQVEGDLQRFKEFIENRGQETGAWRGAIGDNQAVVDQAAAFGAAGAASAAATTAGPGTTSSAADLTSDAYRVRAADIPTERAPFPSERVSDIGIGGMAMGPTNALTSEVTSEARSTAVGSTPGFVPSSASSAGVNPPSAASAGTPDADDLLEAEAVHSWTETGADVDPTPVTEMGNEELAEEPLENDRVDAPRPRASAPADRPPSG
jgi:hypothetical protein